MKKVVGGSGYNTACAASSSATGTAICVENDTAAELLVGGVAIAKWHLMFVVWTPCIYTNKYCNLSRLPKYG